MDAFTAAIHGAILFPILSSFIGFAALLTEFVHSGDGKRWSVLVPIGGVLLIAGSAYSLAEAGTFCAFCN